MAEPATIIEDLPLRRDLPRYLCPFCAEPVGYVGNFFSWLLGTRIHGCDFSNVMSVEEIHDLPAPPRPCQDERQE